MFELLLYLIPAAVTMFFVIRVTTKVKTNKEIRSDNDYENGKVLP